MKRIAIFGATGGVGLHVTEVALKRGTSDIPVLLKGTYFLYANIVLLQGNSKDA